MKLIATTLGVCLSLLWSPVSSAGDALLLERGSVWRFLDDGSDQGIAWRASGFDDAAWGSGAAQLGYGDGDETTRVGFGDDSNDKHITTYFRSSFNLADPSAFVGLGLSLLRDDGAVVYLNGTEVVRSNMPGGVIGFGTPASDTVGGAAEDIFLDFVLSPSLLVAGENVVAVEIHQRSGTSSDISFDFELRGIDTPSVVRGPYLQRGTPESVVVRWRTDLASSSVVRFGADPGDLSQSVTSIFPRTEHEIEITGLSPATTYYYSVGDLGGPFAGGDEDHLFRTSPDTGTTGPVRVWAVGDSGTADANAAAVRDGYLSYAGARQADLWLMLGDNAYEDGTDAEHQAAIFDMYPSILRSTVLWPTLGNHDGRSANSNAGTGVYYDAFTLPTGGEAGGLASGTEAYYSFDYANLHVVCLESYETERSLSGPMMSWLAADVAATTQDWIIAFWHHPPYTKGSHDSDTEMRLIQMRSNALPILEGAGVDLVLTGHSHSHERSYLVDGHYGTSDTLEPLTMILDAGDGHEAGDGAYAKPTPGLGANEGTVYVVAGSSGKLTAAPLDHPVMYTSNLVLGSLLIDVEDLRMDVRFLDDFGFVVDHFTILKGGVPCAPDLAAPFGLLDFFDVLEFLGLFDTMSAGADLAEPFGVWNMFDVLAYLDLFDAGCP